MVYLFVFKAEQFRKILLAKYVYKDEYNPVNGRVASPNQTGFNFNMKRFSLAIANRSFGSFTAAQQGQPVDSGPQSGSNQLAIKSASPGAELFKLKDVEEQDERDQKRYKIQCELSAQGASDLVVDLFMSEISNKVFKENVLLAIALLEGGNTQVQVIKPDQPAFQPLLS